MKNVIIFLLTFIPLVNYSQNDFCNGWENGYKRAYEDNNKFVGITPVCPIPKIGADTYTIGYKLGLKKP